MQTKPTSRLVDGSLALRARQRASGAAQPKAAASPKAKKIALVIAVFGLLVGGGFGAVWAWNYMGRQARLAKIDEFRDKMQDPSLTDEQRRALWGENRQLFDGLSAEDRRAAFARGGGGFGRMRNEEDRIKKFLAMTQAEQDAELDKEIQRRLDREKEREARDKARAADAAKTDGSSANGSQDGKNGNDSSGSGSDSGGPRAAKTDAQRKLAQNSRLSSIPPQQRVQMSQNRQLNQAYNNMVQARAAQQGISLPAPSGFGRRGG